MASLNELLGYAPEDKLLIVNADDIGLCYSANIAGVDAMKNGLVTSGSIMVPCPGFAHIAEFCKDDPSLDFGVHLTHTCEWVTCRWGPVADAHKVKGLMDEEGFMWRDIREVYENYCLEEAEIEARAQIEKALAWGIDVTHIDSHMGVLQFNLDYWEIYIRLAEDYDLPVRMGTPELEAAFGAGHLRSILREKGILFPDRLIIGERKEGEDLKDYFLRVLRSLSPGVTELFIHPALPTEEMKNIAGSWEERAREYYLFRWDEDIKKAIREEGIKLIGYRALRDVQRRLRKVQAK